VPKLIFGSVVKSENTMSFLEKRRQHLDKMIESTYQLKSDVERSLLAATDPVDRFRLNDYLEQQEEALKRLQKELALCLAEQNNTMPAIAEKTIAVLTPVSETVPPLPELFIGREEDFQYLKGRFGILSGYSRQPFTVIHGWPGVGKTTLVNSLAYDAEIAANFPDGVLWAALGQHPEPLAELAKWGRALGVRDMGGSRLTLQEAIDRVRILLRDKQVLLIVDDVWEADHAIPFKIVGPKCSMLFTTRFPIVAHELASKSGDRWKLKHLNEEKSLELLSLLAPQFYDSYPQEALQLARDLEGLPLALRVAGRLVEAEVSSGFGVKEVLQQLRESSKLLESKAPDDRFNPLTGTTPTVDLLFKQSTDLLDEVTRDRFARLGVLAPKPAIFTLEEMGAVWMEDNPRPAARKLVDRGLLEPVSCTDYFQMHAVLVMHAQKLLEEDEE
jgi:hypothetical protein